MFAEYDLTYINTMVNPTKPAKKTNFFKRRGVAGSTGYIICTLMVWIGVFLMIFPYLWMLLGSLKSDMEIREFYNLFPLSADWSSFANAITYNNSRFLYGFRNTIIIEIIVIPIGTFTSSLAAFAFAKIRFRHKRALLILLMTSMMVPYCSVFMAQYEMFSKLGWVLSGDFRSLLPFIVPGLFSRCSMIFFLVTFMKNAIHDSIIESAKIDGASFFKIYWKLVLPLSKSAIAAQMIFWFVAIWNDYFGPSIYLDPTTDYLTLQVSLQTIYNNFQSYKMNTAFAASFMSSVPMIIFFLIFRNQFVRSTALSGVKE